MYNGEGLGLKGSVACRRSTAGFEEISRFEESSKRHQRASRGIEDFKGGFEGFKGVSHDNYPPFKVTATQRDGSARMRIDLPGRNECVQS